MKRKWDVSTDEVRRKCVEEIITRIDEQKDEVIGIIAAEEIIEIVTQNIGPDIYNLALKDAKKLLQNHLSDIEAELDLLHQRG